MAMTNKLNLTIIQGATWRYVLQLKAGPTANAPPLQLGGYSARMQVRSELASPDPLINLTSQPGGGITIGPLTGELALHISDTDTAALNFDQAVYDLELTAPGGDVTRVLQGKVLLSLEVTR